MRFEHGQVQAPELAQPVDLRTAGHLRRAQRFQSRDPLDRRLSTGCGEVGNRGQARKSPLDDLHAVAAIEQRFVDLVEVSTTEVDQPARFGPLGVVEKVEPVFAVLILQHEVHALPLLVLLALLVQVTLHADAARFFHARLFTTLAKGGVDLLGARGSVPACGRTVRLRAVAARNAQAEGVALDDLLALVAVDDGVQAVECTAAHHVADALLLDAETLDLVVDVEE